MTWIALQSDCNTVRFAERREIRGFALLESIFKNVVVDSDLLLA